MKQRKMITLKVDWHPSNGGNRTLKEAIKGHAYCDLSGALFCNANSTKFYRAVARRIAKRSKEFEVIYRDTSQPN